MTLKQFRENGKILAIPTPNFEQARIFWAKFHKLGEAWYNGDTCKKDTHWDLSKNKTCYTNIGSCTNYEYCKSQNIPIILFDEIDDFKHLNYNELKTEENECLSSDEVMTLKKDDVLWLKDLESKKSLPIKIISVWREDILIGGRIYYQEFGFSFNRNIRLDDLNIQYSLYQNPNRNMIIKNETLAELCSLLLMVKDNNSTIVTKSGAKFHEAIFAIQQEYPDLFTDLIFDESGITPFSDELERMLFGLGSGEVLSTSNSECKKYEIKDIAYLTKIAAGCNKNISKAIQTFNKIMA